MSHDCELIVMRAISGSGKSTRAHQLAATVPAGSAVVLSTDEFFMNEQTGEYDFQVSLLAQAHTWNQYRAEAGVLLCCCLCVVRCVCASCALR